MPDDQTPLISSGGDTNNEDGSAIKQNKNIDGVNPNASDATTYVDLKKTNTRWCMLFMACCFLLGSYFCYDNPGPIETQLEEDYHLDSTQYSYLYTVYSMPNMVLPIFGGLFLDKIGIRAGLILFTCVLTLG